MTETIPVECGVGWIGKRRPGNIITCPKCGSIAGFQCALASPSGS